MSSYKQGRRNVKNLGGDKPIWLGIIWSLIRIGLNGSDKNLVGTSLHVPKIRSDGPEYNALNAGSRQDVVVEIVDMRQHIFRSETRQVLTLFWSWLNLFCMKISCGAAIPKRNIRHVTVADRGHCDNGPPEAVRNGLEVGVRRTGLRKINCTWKENHA